MKKRALISVSDKTGIIDFARSLTKNGWEIISSGGTAKTLRDNSIECREVSEVTGFPEILDGRVKTLNPKIHGGILAVRGNKTHLEQLNKHEIETIDMVVVNLYPFEKTISGLEKPADKKIPQDVIENIDIGGVALLRAAAKNYADIIVVSDSADYKKVIENLDNPCIDFRLELAAKAFRRTAFYDAVISGFLTYQKFPEECAVPLKKISGLRYGENPHQAAAVYGDVSYQNTACVIGAKQLHGKELSYNNYLDLESAWHLVWEFEKPACAIIKHNNPCGCAEAQSQVQAYLDALLCDPVSAFGGILAFNRELDAATAQEISKLFVECVIAPDFTKEAFDILAQKKNIRLLRQKRTYKNEAETQYRTMSEGMLVQEKDANLAGEIKNMGKRAPTTDEKESLDFAWKVSKHVKSNAIILAMGTQTVGIGAGQMSRIDSLDIAVKKMKQIEGLPQGRTLAMASDAFFPFPDVVLGAAKAGVRAIIQPGGSIKDEESIKAADENDIAMVGTGMRHFRH